MLLDPVLNDWNSDLFGSDYNEGVYGTPDEDVHWFDDDEDMRRGVLRDRSDDCTESTENYVCSDNVIVKRGVGRPPLKVRRLPSRGENGEFISDLSASTNAQIDIGKFINESCASKNVQIVNDNPNERVLVCSRMSERGLKNGGLIVKGCDRYDNASVVERKAFASIKLRFREAMSNHRDEFIEAIKREVSQCEKFEAFRRIHSRDIRRGEKVVGSMLLLNRKDNGRAKARIVVLGNQMEASQWEDIRASVVAHTSFRTVLIESLRKWGRELEMCYVDVDTAFLQSDHVESSCKNRLIVKPPQELVELGLAKTGEFWVVDSALYGQRDAPKRWQDTMSKWMNQQGDVRQSSMDSNAYILYSKDSICACILVYVDDVACFGARNHVKGFLERVRKRFECSQVSKLEDYLGFQLCRRNDGILVSQEKYISSILEKVGMKGANSVKTPLETGDDVPVWLKGDEVLSEKGMSEFHTDIGRLMYLCVNTRPDISYAVGRLACSMQKPTKRHTSCLKRIYRYLCGTPTLGLLYSYSPSFDYGLQVFVDSSWGAPRSVAGTAVMLFGHVACWFSKRETVVAMSSSEAELIAASMGAREARFVQLLWEDLTRERLNTKKLHCDNAGTLFISKSEGLVRKVRHLELSHYYVRELRTEHGFDLEKVASSDNVADIFTKSVGPQKLNLFRNMLGLSN